jgi:hypothetical protein
MSKSLAFGKTALRALVATVTGLLVLTGCAQIPMTSAVKQGPDIQSGLSNDYLYYSPAGPVNGEAQADVLAGFLNASTGPQNDYGVAREYLAPDFKAKWSPNDKVYIQSGSLHTAFGANGEATVTFQVSATVDAQGHYNSRVNGSTQVLSFKLASVDGQWRIIDAPNAVVMIRPVFEVIFHSYNLYFFDKANRYLIPDLRWFPARASTATRLAAAILAGPSKWLEPAVSQTMPTGTKLALDAVTVSNKSAVVNVSAQAVQASATQKQQFKAQLQATLSQLAGVTNVDLQIASAAQKIPEYSAASTTSGAYAPVVLESNQLQQLVGPSGSRLANANAWISSLKATDFAVTSDQTGVALMNGAGVYAARLDQAGSAPVLVDSRKNLLTPRFDRRGQLWILNSEGQVQVRTSSGKSTWLNIGWLKGHTVEAFTVSPEGARLGLIVADAKGKLRVLITSIIRDAHGNVMGFGVPVELQRVVGTPKDLEWSGLTDLMVLSEVSTDQSNLTLLSVGGEPIEIGSVDHSYDLMSSDDGSNIYVLDSRRRLLQYHGYTWSLLDQDVVAAHMAN